MMVLGSLGGLDTVRWVADVYASPRQCVTTQTPVHARTRYQDEERGAERLPRRVWIAIVGLSPEAYYRPSLKELMDKGCTFDRSRLGDEQLERYAVAVAVPGTPGQTVADMCPERRFNAEPHCSLQAFIKDLPRGLGIKLIAKLQSAAKKQLQSATKPVTHTEKLNFVRRWGYLGSHFGLLSPRWDGPGDEPSTILQAINWEPPHESPGRGRLLQDPERRHLAGLCLRLQGWHLPAGARSGVPQIPSMGACGLPLCQEPAPGVLAGALGAQVPRDARPCG